MIQGIRNASRNMLEAIQRHPTFNLPEKLERARAEQADADALLAAYEERISVLLTNGYCGIWITSMAEEREKIERAQEKADRFRRIVRTLERMEGGADMEFSTKQGESQ